LRLRHRILGAAVIAVLLASSNPAIALQCVPFARQVSGIGLRGDAWTWWSAAAGQYERGQVPRAGAVVVFKKFRSMRHGHVAVVRRVLNSREVLVDHANWAPQRGYGRGQVAKLVAVTDVSPRNDWTEVRVWNMSSQDFGTRTYPTYGFIYSPAEDSYSPAGGSAYPQPATFSPSENGGHFAATAAAALSHGDGATAEPRGPMTIAAVKAEPNGPTAWVAGNAFVGRFCEVDPGVWETDPVTAHPLDSDRD
jgi:surface antigen